MDYHGWRPSKTADQACVWLFGQSPVAAGLAYGLVSCTSARVYDNSAAAAAVAACGAIQVLCLSYLPFTAPKYKRHIQYDRVPPECKGDTKI